MINKRQRIIEVLTTAMEKPEIANALIQRVINELNKTQPEPEPVAWMYIKKNGMQVITNDPDYKDGTWTPLYDTPPQREWQSLTDDDLNALHYELKVQCMGVTGPVGMYRILEKALKEKNGA